MGCHCLLRVKVRCLKYLQIIFYDSTLTHFLHPTVIFFTENSLMIVQYPPLPLLKASSSLNPQIKTSVISNGSPDSPIQIQGPCLSFHFYSLSIPCSFHVQILTLSRRLPASLLPPACPTHGGQIHLPKIQFCSVAQVLLGRSVWLGRSRFDIG